MRQPYTNVFPTTALLNEEVLNISGEHLGDIQDFVVDIHEGRISYLILSIGGFMGMGAKLIAIPWNAFDMDTGGFVLNVDNESLESAPSFEEAEWPNMSDRHWSEQIHSYYDYTPDKAANKDGKHPQQ